MARARGSSPAWQRKTRARRRLRAIGKGERSVRVAIDELQQASAHQLEALKSSHQATLRQLELASREDLQTAVARARQDRDADVAHVREEAARERERALRKVKTGHEKKLLEVSAKFQGLVAQAEQKGREEREQAVSAIMETSKDDLDLALRQLEKRAR